MRNVDFAPLYRTSVGFDRMANLLDSISRNENKEPAYPPYNIELTGEDQYRITMAVAGFDQSELNIVVDQNKLTVASKKESDNTPREYLHQGIAARNFERRFQLADHVKVKDANVSNGLLHIDLQREIPEAMKPRTIEIGANTSSVKINGELSKEPLKAAS